MPSPPPPPQGLYLAESAPSLSFLFFLFFFFAPSLAREVHFELDLTEEETELRDVK